MLSTASRQAPSTACWTASGPRSAVQFSLACYCLVSSRGWLPTPYCRFIVSSIRRLSCISPWCSRSPRFASLYSILATQWRADRLAEHREKLILQLTFVSEQKSAKLIALVEELRRDLPHVRNRVDREAQQMIETVNVTAVSEAVKGAEAAALGLGSESANL
jgi:hypothetical protein